jgi:hypothetical protein
LLRVVMLHVVTLQRCLLRTACSRCAERHAACMRLTSPSCAPGLGSGCRCSTMLSPHAPAAVVEWRTASIRQREPPAMHAAAARE